MTKTDDDETPSTFKAIGVAMKEIVSDLRHHHHEDQHGAGTDDCAGYRCQHKSEDDHRAAVVAKDRLVKLVITRLHGDAPVIVLADEELRRRILARRVASRYRRAGGLRMQARMN